MFGWFKKKPKPLFIPEVLDHDVGKATIRITTRKDIYLLDIKGTKRRYGGPYYSKVLPVNVEALFVDFVEKSGKDGFTKIGLNKFIENRRVKSIELVNRTEFFITIKG
jgi:hypothetical protein